MARRGEGMRVRISPIKGETPKSVLTKAFYLPGLIGSLASTEEFLHTDYETYRAGQFSQPGMGPATARRLRTLDDFETLTLTWDPAWLVEQGLEPAAVRRNLFAVGRGRKPVNLFMSLDLRRKPWLRMDVTFRSIREEMRTGEPDTTYFTIRVEEWRNASTRRKGGSSGPPSLPTTHTLTATDTLYSLAYRYYKNSARASLIENANAIYRWGRKDPLVKMKQFKVGSKIRIPAVPNVASVIGRTSHLPGGITSTQNIA